MKNKKSLVIKKTGEDEEGDQNQGEQVFRFFFHNIFVYTIKAHAVVNFTNNQFDFYHSLN